MLVHGPFTGDLPCGLSHSQPSPQHTCPLQLFPQGVPPGGSQRLPHPPRSQVSADPGMRCFAGGAQVCPLWRGVGSRLQTQCAPCQPGASASASLRGWRPPPWSRQAPPQSSLTMISLSNNYQVALRQSKATHRTAGEKPSMPTSCLHRTGAPMRRRHGAVPCPASASGWGRGAVTSPRGKVAGASMCRGQWPAPKR